MSAVRAALLTVVLTVAVGCVGAPPPSPVTAPPPSIPPLSNGLPAPAVRWQPCPSLPGGPPPDTPGLQCTTLRVPLDYADPAGRQIDLAVSRLSGGPGRPALVSNPGGPGAPGLFNSLGVDGLTGGALRDRFDLIGVDPRGIGRSTPVRCGLDPTTAGYGTGGSAPRGFDADAATARTIAEACARAAGERLPHMTTLNTARDLDMIRKALDRDSLTVVGTSYGTELAVTYATLFPRGTARVLLDGVQDVTVPPRAAQQHSAAAADARFTEIASRIAADDARWHLGSTPQAVRERYLRTAARLEIAPAVVGGEVVDAAVLQSARLQPALLDDADIEPLALALAYLAGAPGAPSESQLIARLDAGSQGSASLPYGQSVDEAVSAYFAVRCDDADWPRDPELYRRESAEEAARYPATRGQYSKISPCAYWPNTAREPQVPVTDRGWSGGPNILILQNLRDLRAAAPGVDATRRALGSRAVSVAVDDYRHVALGANPCATDRAVGWLVDGELPPGDVRC